MASARTEEEEPEGAEPAAEAGEEDDEEEQAEQAEQEAAEDEQAEAGQAEERTRRQKLTTEADCRSKACRQQTEGRRQKRQRAVCPLRSSPLLSSFQAIIDIVA